MIQLEVIDSVTIPSCILYEKDILYILRYPRTEIPCYSISDENFINSSLDEFKKEAGLFPKNFIIHHSDMEITITFAKKFTKDFGIRIIGNKHNPYFHAIKNFLESRQLWINRIFKYQPIFILFPVSVYLLTDLGKNSIIWAADGKVGIILLFATLIYAILTLLLNTGYLFSIRLIEKKTRNGFFHRNSDKIFISILTAVIVQIINWFSTNLSK